MKVEFYTLDNKLLLSMGMLSLPLPQERITVDGKLYIVSRREWTVAKAVSKNSIEARSCRIYLVPLKTK